MKCKLLILCTLLLLFAGCRNERLQREVISPVAETYISLQIKTEGSTLKAQQPDWPGIDIVEYVYLYAFDAVADDPGTIIPIKMPEEEQRKATIQVTKPWRAKVGRKQFYIVVNPSPDIITALRTACETSRTAFDRAYRETAYNFLEDDSFTEFERDYWNSDRLALTKHFIDSLALVKTDPTQDNITYMTKYGMVQPSKALTYIRSKKSATEFDVVSKIMMTGEPVTQEIKADVSAHDAPAQNNVAFTVARTVAQVVVTEAGEGMFLSGISGRQNSQAPLLRYAVLYHERTSYLLGRTDAQSGEFVSPSYGVANASRYNAPASSHSDYKLWNYVPYNTLSGSNLTIDTPLEDVIIPSTNHPYKDYGGLGYGESFLMGGFYIPESAQPSDTYTWTNAPIVVIQVSFRQTSIKRGDEDVVKFSSVMYQGTKTKKFYNNYANAFRENNPAGAPLPPNSNTPEEQVNLKDNVITYPGARAYYIVPVNPLTGEVRRNHIYRLHIKGRGVKKGYSVMGYSGIPLPKSPIPCDPDDKPLEPFSLGSITRSATHNGGRVHTFEVNL